MAEKRKTALGEKSHAKSVKLRQETKNKVDEMLVSGEKITFKRIMEECGVSKGFVYDKDIRVYIDEAIRLQKEEMLNLPNQQQNLFWKLMAAYIFQYSLMDEQEALLKDSIDDLKKRKARADYSIRLLAKYLAIETDLRKAKDEIQAFLPMYYYDIPDFTQKLITLIKEITDDCPAPEIYPRKRKKMANDNNVI